MAAVALIVFDQGGPGPAGQAFLGTVSGGLVTITNDNNTDVLSWAITLLDVPAGSGLVPGVLATADSGVPTASFSPDVAGSYRIMLDVYEATGLTGILNRDIRNFGINSVRNIIIPPYQKLPDPLPVTGSGLPGEKPNEQNYSGNTRGWAAQLTQFFLNYDDLAPFLVTSTPFTPTISLTVSDYPIYVVGLVSIGSDAVFNLPSTLVRAGQRFRVAAEAGSTYKVTVTASGGQTINGQTTWKMLSGTTSEFLYIGSNRWIILGAKTDRYERTLVGGVEDTDQTGFVTIGSTVLDLDNFVNLPGGQVTWQAILETTDILDSAEIRLFNITGAAVVAGSVLSTASLTPVLVSTLLTLPVSGPNLYEAQLRLQTTGAPNRATCKQAQLIVDWLQP